MSDKRIFLVTVGEKERLVEAETARAAVQHCVSVQRASAADVARVMKAGGQVEQANEG